MRLTELDSLHLLDGSVKLPVQFILDNAYLTEGDAAFVGGSLIEGLGNRHSDVDVHVLVRETLTASMIRPQNHYRILSRDRTLVDGELPAQDVFLIHTVIPGTQIKIDIEYRTFAEVEQLVSTVEEIFSYATRSLILLTKTLPVREMAFLHRMFNCADIQNTEYLDELRERIGIARFLYLMYRWKASDFSVLLDILGAWENNELIRCADLARENMVTQFHAYCHLCGNTNYHRKWIIPYARKLKVEKTILSRFESLLLTGSFLTENELKEFILNTFDFCDDLFRAGVPLIESQEEYPSGEAALRLLDAHVKEEAGEYSDMEVIYRKKAYSINGLSIREWFK